MKFPLTPRLFLARTVCSTCSLLSTTGALGLPAIQIVFGKSFSKSIGLALVPFPPVLTDSARFRSSRTFPVRLFLRRINYTENYCSSRFQKNSTLRFFFAFIQSPAHNFENSSRFQTKQWLLEVNKYFIRNISCPCDSETLINCI